MTSSLVIIAISLLCSAFFSGMEIAFFAANKLRLELDKKQGGPMGRIIGLLTQNPSQYITTMLVGNNIALVVYGVEIAKLLDPFIVEHITQRTMLVLLIQTLISTCIILITAEFLPKSIFRRYPNTLLTAMAPVALLFYALFYPICRFATWMAYIAIRYVLRCPIGPQDGMKMFGRVDLDNLVEQAQPVEDEGGSHEQELRIFQNALDFSEVRLRDCMVPRTDIEAIGTDEPVQALHQRFIETSLSVKGIRKTGFGIPGHGIDGEIPPGQVFRQVVHKVDRVRMTVVGIVPVNPVGGYLIGNMIHHNGQCAVLQAGFHGMKIMKDFLHLLRQGGGTDIPVMGLQAQHGITDAAADHIRRKAGFIQPAEQDGDGSGKG